MQIYDEANALARAIRESEDCRAYRQLSAPSAPTPAPTARKA